MSKRLAEILASFFDCTDTHAAVLVAPTEQEMQCIAALGEAGADLVWHQVQDMWFACRASAVM